MSHRLIRQFNLEATTAAVKTRHLRTRQDLGASVCRISGIEGDKPSILHPGIGILEGLGISLAQGLPGRIVCEVQRPCFRQQLATADVIVQEEAEPQEPSRPESAMMR